MLIFPACSLVASLIGVTSTWLLSSDRSRTAIVSSWVSSLEIASNPYFVGPIADLISAADVLREKTLVAPRDSTNAWFDSEAVVAMVENPDNLAN